MKQIKLPKAFHLFKRGYRVKRELEWKIGFKLRDAVCNYNFRFMSLTRKDI